jgi:hypothetical protein
VESIVAGENSERQSDTNAQKIGLASAIPIGYGFECANSRQAEVRFVEIGHTNRRFAP